MDLILSIITQCLVISVISGNKNHPGEVLPKLIELEVGHSINITCRMNPNVFSGEDSRSLRFIYDDTKQPVLDEDIYILNETTIVYTMRNATKQDRHYTCTSGQFGVDQTHVFVGEKPLEILDFKCRGYDFVYMSCNFTKPENPVATKYDVSYYARSPNYRQDCVPQIQNNHQICNFTQEQNNYRLNYELFNFIVVGSNTLGTLKQTFTIDHDEIVIPGRPNIRFENITTNSVTLKWNMNRFIYYKKGLLYEIRVKPENMPWLINYNDYEFHNKASEYSILLRNLPFAFYSFTVSVRIRINWKKADWSDPFVGTFKTLSKIPDSPPDLDPSSFFLINDNQLRLFWKQLPVHHQNGPNFSYVIEEMKVDGTKSDLKPYSMDLASASFIWDWKRNYEFSIKSRNLLGESVKASSIYIPSLPKSLDSYIPQWISHINHSPNRTLTWEPPSEQNNLIDYTVYWCQSIKEIFNDCKESLQFVHLPKNTTSFTSTPLLQNEYSLNFAVAANYKNFSTGMHWSMCPADVSSDLVKLKPEIQATEPNTIEIQWSLDGICTSSIVEGYNLTFCEIDELVHENSNCLYGNTTVTIEKTRKKFKVTNLKPFTIYKMEILMFSKEKVGSPSDSLTVKTKENASSEPRDLIFKNVMSNSVVIFWKPPESFNGILRYYKIIQNKEEYLINCTSESYENFCLQDEMEYKLNDLESFTDYEISIIAHTIKDSKPSEKIHFKTLIGAPSSPEHHQTKSEDDQTLFEWDKPEKPNGRLEFYEVALTILYKNEIHQEYISTIVNATSCLVKIPTCKAISYSHTLTVRAINVVFPSEEIDKNILGPTNHNHDEEHQMNEMNPAENNYLECKSTSSLSEEQQKDYYNYLSKNIQLKSAWANPQIYHCAESRDQVFKIFALAFLCILLLGLVLLVVWFLRKTYLKMSNIKCAVPEALNTTYPIKNTIGIDNNQIDDDDDFRKGKEFATTEVHHLLSPFNDSGYLCNDGLNDGVLGDNGGITPISLGKSSGYSGSDHYDEQQDYTPDDQFQFKTHHPSQEYQSCHKDSYMAMELPKDNITNNDLGKAPIKNDGYTAVKDFTKQCSHLNFIPTENTYVKPNKTGWQSAEQNQIFTTENSSRISDSTNLFNNGVGGVPMSGSYVSPQMFTKPNNNNGYTTLEALGKPSVPSLITTPSSHNRHGFEGGGISGYVTQKELSEFGQKRLS